MNDTFASMSSFLRLLALIFFVVSIPWLQSCREESDEIYPVIDMQAPPGNEKYAVFDTIEVRAAISDNKIIASVGVTLVNENKIPVTNVSFKYPGTAAYLLVSDLVLSDKYIETGDYYIQVQASDGQNVKYNYQPVQVEGLEKMVLGYIALTASGSLTTNVYRLTNEFIPDSSFIFPHGHQFSLLNPFYEQFYMVTPYPSRIYSFALGDFEEQWVEPAALPSPAFLCGVCNEETWLSTQNGDILAYNSSGRVVFRTSVLPAFSIPVFNVGEIFVNAGAVSSDGNVRYFTSYYKTSGLLYYSVGVTEEIVAIEPVQKKALIFANEVSGLVINEFDPENLNSITQLYYLPGMRFEKVQRAGNGIYLSKASGRVFKYDYNQNTLSLFYDDDTGILRYDEVNGLVFVSSGVDLLILDGKTGEVIRTVSFDHPVLDLHAIYNK